MCDVSAENYPGMISRRTASQLLERLVTAPNGKAFWNGLVKRVQELVKQKTVLVELQTILAGSRTAFKHQSHQGAVKLEGRWQDAGNWYYTVLYLSLIHI